MWVSTWIVHDTWNICAEAVHMSFLLHERCGRWRLSFGFLISYLLFCLLWKCRRCARFFRVTCRALVGRQAVSFGKRREEELRTRASVFSHVRHMVCWSHAFHNMELVLCMSFARDPFLSNDHLEGSCRGMRGPGRLEREPCAGICILLQAPARENRYYALDI